MYYFRIMYNLAIHSNRVITASGVQNATVVIKNGLISDILPGAAITDALDIGNDVLMAGIIDPHVHINEPGRTEWEGFNTATRAAIASGITALIDMPLNSSPVTTTVKALEEKISSTKGQLHTKCGFWGGVIPGNEKEIEALIAYGVCGFKAFLVHSGIDEFPNVTEADLRKAMPLIAKHGVPLLLHCELETMSDKQPSTLHRSYKNYLASRPRKWEDDAIAMMIRLCEEFDCPVHVVHLSSADSITQIKKAKGKGLRLTVETAHHYLYFNAENISNGRTDLKCAPPIREKENNEQLWQALKDGIIDFVATDHSPATLDLKAVETGDFSKAWGGISSLQFSLPILWTAAKKRNCTINDIAKWLCEKPAMLPGLQKTKGKIEKGFDADLVSWNPDEKFTVTEDIILHRHKLTPYFYEELSGVVKQVFLKGEKVFDKGEFIKLNKGSIILRK